jgi:hypothetical protein
MLVIVDKVGSQLRLNGAVDSKSCDGQERAHVAEWECERRLQWMIT